MIEVELASLTVDSRGAPVVILRPIEDDRDRARLLPIFIGVQEATAIMLAAEGSTASRPMSYDLMVRLLKALGGTLVGIAVTRLEGGTFFAEITLDTPSGRQWIDARPSDSIALAMRLGAPMFVARAVLDEAAVTEEEATGERATASPPSAEEQESQIAAFTDFLDQVDPDDFKG
jgi:hypothetical protein